MVPVGMGQLKCYRTTSMCSVGEPYLHVFPRAIIWFQLHACVCVCTKSADLPLLFTGTLAMATARQTALPFVGVTCRRGKDMHCELFLLTNYTITITVTNEPTSANKSHCHLESVMLMIFMIFRFCLRVVHTPRFNLGSMPMDQGFIRHLLPPSLPLSTSLPLTDVVHYTMSGCVIQHTD